MIKSKDRAEILIEKALYEHRSGLDALPTLSAACMVLRMNSRELPTTDLDEIYEEYFEEE